MATLRTTAIVPLLDDGGNRQPLTTYMQAMEIIALDGISQLEPDCFHYVSGNFDSEYQRVSHYIVDTNLATATTNYNNLVSSITKGGMVPHFVSVVMNSYT